MVSIRVCDVRDDPSEYAAIEAFVGVGANDARDLCGRVVVRSLVQDHQLSSNPVMAHSFHSFQERSNFGIVYTDIHRLSCTPTAQTVA